MKRRDFLKILGAAAVVPQLPESRGLGMTLYPVAKAVDRRVGPQQFTDYLIAQIPRYDQAILKEITNAAAS